MEHSLPPPLPKFLSQRFRDLRKAAGERQEETAERARSMGLRWSRATVAGIESGRRKLSTEEFLLLPFVLNVELSDLFPETHERIQLTPGHFIRARSIRLVIKGQAKKVDRLIDINTTQREEKIRSLKMITLYPGESAEREIWKYIWPDEQPSDDMQYRCLEDAIRDTEIKASKKLGVASLAVAVAAQKLWGRSLVEERDFRVLEKENEKSTPRTVQALRGHVSRTLLTEMEQVVAGLRGLKITQEEGAGAVIFPRASQRASRSAQKKQGVS